MENNLKSEMNNIPLPASLTEYSERGLEKAMQEQDKNRSVLHEGKKNKRKKAGLYIAGSAALVILSVFTLGFISPVMANILKDIPIVGSIFKADKNELSIDATAQKSLDKVYEEFPELKNYHMGLILKGTRKRVYGVEQWDITFTKEKKELNTTEGDASVEIEISTGEILNVHFQDKQLAPLPHDQAEQQAKDFLQRFIGNESKQYIVQRFEDNTLGTTGGTNVVFSKKMQPNETFKTISVRLGANVGVRTFARGRVEPGDLTGNQLNRQEIQSALNKLYKVYPEAKKLEVVRANRGKRDVGNLGKYESTQLWVQEKGKNDFFGSVEYDLSGNLLSLSKFETLPPTEKPLPENRAKEKAAVLVKDLYEKNWGDYAFSHVETKTFKNKDSITKVYFKHVNIPKKELEIAFNGDGSVVSVTNFEKK